MFASAHDASQLKLVVMLKREELVGVNSDELANVQTYKVFNASEA